MEINTLCNIKASYLDIKVLQITLKVNIETISCIYSNQTASETNKLCTLISFNSIKAKLYLKLQELSDTVEVKQLNHSKCSDLH